MQPPGVDPHLDALAGTRVRADPEAADDDGAAGARLALQIGDPRAVDVLEDLPDLLREDGWGFELDVGEQLRAQELRRHDPAAEPVRAGDVAGEGGILELLRADSEADRPARVGLEPRARVDELRREGELLTADGAGEIAAAALEPRLDQVHLGAADEARDEQVGRAVVHLLRRVDLL